MKCCARGAALLLAFLLSAGPATARPVPREFFGIVPQGPLTASDLDRMEGAVGTLRIPVVWSEVEPEAGVRDFQRFDELIAAAAERGIRVLPVVYGTPAWLAPQAARPPLGDGRAREAWAFFLHLLVSRYGRGGAFWGGRSRRLPVHDWQIWNEPNFKLFWRPRPSPRGYAHLLAISARAIRHVDADARIFTGGVAPVGGGLLPWVFLRRLYRVPGVQSAFDVLAVHPYAPSVGQMRVQVRDARTVMDAAGDTGTPMVVSEFGVASQGVIPSAFVLGPEGQARFARDALRLLLSKRRAWGIVGADWFTWRDGLVPDRHCSFCEGAGLIDAEGRPKPAWGAFRRVAAAATQSGVR